MSEEIKKTEVKEEVIAAEAATPVEETTPEVTAPAGNPVIDIFAKYGVGAEEAQKIADNLGIDVPEDFFNLDAEDLVGAGMKLAKARNLIADLKAKDEAKAETPAATAVASTMMRSQLATLLPTVPSDESWLSSLKTGGILKVDESTYIAAIRAALADRAGLYDVPKTLVKQMEAYALEMEEPVSPTYYSIRKALTRRNYGDIFAAIDGCDGTTITDAKRNELLRRVDKTLWPAIAKSYFTLDAWYKNYKDSFADPSMMFAILAGGLAGAASTPVTTAPDTAPVRDASETMVTAINRVFAGEGVQVASAMAYEAKEILRTLDIPTLPAMTGAPNREQMLKKIGTSVTSDYVRLEQNLVKYVLSYIKFAGTTSDVEVDYLIALWQLGSQIRWSELGISVSSSDKVGLTGKQIL